MKAYFKTRMAVVRSHAILADLVVVTGEYQHLQDAEITITDWRYVGHSDEPISVVFGAPHAIMRLIGAFADDGMDCLVKVDP